MSNIFDKVNDAISGRQGDTATGHTAGPHRSDMANRADPRVEQDRGQLGNPVGGTGPGGMGSTHTAGSTNYGPHGSNVANKIDPRVDSDRDGSGLYGAPGTHGTTGLGSTGTHGTTGLGATGSTGHGPHDSSMANKLDPRVDSDRDDRSGLGSTGTHGTYGTTGTESTGTHTGTGYGTSTNVGPHHSNMANKPDPYVSSGRDGHTGLGSATRGTHGTAGTGYPTLGTHGATGTGPTGIHNGTGYGTSASRGPHGSNVMNTLDPRVDSDREHRAPHASTYTGPAPNTAGPHKSDLVNKLDPRVDSDLDGSKTIGADKTYATGSGPGAARIE